MLKEEATWINDKLKQLESNGKSIYPFANIGCSDHSNDKSQPWIYELMKSIENGGIKKNIDIKHTPEVDISGDLLDSNFVELLKKENFKTILAANILTNIENKEVFAKNVLNLLTNDTILIVTVANRFPYMADPVDTLFRPSIPELKELFPGTSILYSKIIESESYATKILKNKKVLLITTIRMFLPFYKYKTWVNLVKYIPLLLKPTRASCLILEKKHEH